MKERGDERPDPIDLLRRLAGEERRRAMLRVYLGYARGCGTTTAMLDEARRRKGRGTDAVVGAYQVHGDTAHGLRGLDVVGGTGPAPGVRSLDVDAVLARNPEVVCVDDLAGRDLAGRTRLEAVPRLLEAGITVLGTLHVLSIRNVATPLAAMYTRERSTPVLDDSVLSLIDELELVDIPPAELYERIRANSLLHPAQLARSLQHELRGTVLELLRETALRMIANHSNRQLVGLLRDARSCSTPEVRGRVVLCLPAEKGLEESTRQTAAYAASQDAEFFVGTVRPRRVSDRQQRLMGSYAALTHRQGGEFVRLEGRNVAATLAGFIRDSLATEVILGHRRRVQWWPWDTTSDLIRLVNGVDVHIFRSRRPIPTAATGEDEVSSSTRETSPQRAIRRE